MYEASMILSHYDVGRLDGEKQARKETMIELAQGMLAKGVSWDVITSVTGLDETQLKKLDG